MEVNLFSTQARKYSPLSLPYKVLLTFIERPMERKSLGLIPKA